MSGTSLDGVDAALVEISGCGTSTQVSLIDFLTEEIPTDIKTEIKTACSEEKSSVGLICSLNFKLGYLFADVVKKLCKKAKFSLEQIDYIASHGQTIFHIPQAKENLSASTLQIGEAAIIAYETKTKVVSNFRTMDIAAGGEGAPLVPHSEFILYNHKQKNIALQNIGGIANVTVIPNSGKIEDVYAFDTGPGNMIIDEICHRFFNKKYDHNGDLAAKGKVNSSMLKDLMWNPYFYKKPPKTTGREKFGEQFVNQILNRCKDLNKHDILATVTMFTAKTIAINYQQFIIPKLKIDEMIVSGGGAHNTTLLTYLRELLPDIQIKTQEDYGFSSDAKEAIAFALLGNETLNNKPSNVHSATGAKHNVILGTITPNPFG